MSFVIRWFERLFKLFTRVFESNSRALVNMYATKWNERDIKAYDRRWEELLRTITATSKRESICPLRFAQIPWPIFPPLVEVTPGPFVITRANLTRFLICPYRDDHRTCMEKMLNEIERWNDFELMVAISRNVCKKDKKNVQEAWSRVVLILMEMRGDYAT